MEYNSTDLIWTKNVTRLGGDEWAYMEYNVGDLFNLSWPKGENDMGRTDSQKPKVNQLILLVQSVRPRERAKKITYLTHIVAVVNDYLFVKEGDSHPYSRRVVVIARNAQPVLKPIELDFRRPNRGWSCDISLIVPFERTGLKLSRSQTQTFLWKLFDEKDTAIKVVIESSNDPNELEVDGVDEGEERFYIGRHKYYERDPRIIRQKKEQADVLICEICYFDFDHCYGEHGRGFIECHHIYPIAKGGKRKTTVESLALVCANCHRMLHRRSLEKKYLTVEELKDLFSNRGSS